VPGTQVNCSGLLGLVDCVLNDLLKVGGTLLGQLPVVNGVVALVDYNGIVTLSNQSNVAYISKDRTLTPFLSNAAAAVNAPAAWNSNYTGTGIGVALIDSGVNAHPDFYTTSLLPTSRIVYNQSFIPGNSSASDAYGHGTHIAGLIAGDGVSSTGLIYSHSFKGIAPNANIINLRVLDANGAATDSTVITAINKAISLKSQYNIRVINLSLGRGVFESYKQDPLCVAVEKAWKSGIVVVVAAGVFVLVLGAEAVALFGKPRRVLGNIHEVPVVALIALFADLVGPAGDGSQAILPKQQLQVLSGLWSEP